MLTCCWYLVGRSRNRLTPREAGLEIQIQNFTLKDDYKNRIAIVYDKLKFS